MISLGYISITSAASGRLYNSPGVDPNELTFRERVNINAPVDTN